MESMVNFDYPSVDFTIRGMGRVDGGVTGQRKINQATLL